MRKPLFASYYVNNKDQDLHTFSSAEAQCKNEGDIPTFCFRSNGTNGFSIEPVVKPEFTPENPIDERPFSAETAF